MKHLMRHPRKSLERSCCRKEVWSDWSLYVDDISTILGLWPPMSINYLRQLLEDKVMWTLHSSLHDVQVFSPDSIARIAINCERNQWKAVIDIVAIKSMRKS